jgi:acid phosphatase type 7
MSGLWPASARATIRAPMRRLVMFPVVVVAVAMGGAPSAVAQDPVIAAAGDIACAPDDPVTDTRCHHRATSDLLVGEPIAAVLPLGDLQYNASLSSIVGAGAYHDTWGRVKAISRPVLGNHESGATDYFDYFNGVGAADGPAGPRGKGWYSFDVGSWHLIALNSNCSRPADTTDVVDCSSGSEQERWLRADLAAHPTACTLAYWHHPRYSSGHDGSNTFMQPLWEALADAEVEILLSGHSHDYERFAPLDRNGSPDPVGGIRQFVVGTGGAFFVGFKSTREAHSEIAQNDTFGVLFLTLRPRSYDWRFVPEAGETFTDSGSTPCHGAPPPPPPPPPPPADVTAPAISRLKASPRRFRVADLTAPVFSGLGVSPRRFSIGAEPAAAVKRGTTFRYQLSEAARVRATLSRRAAGRKVGGRCRRRTRANRGRPRCTLYRRVGSFRQQGIAGSNTRQFDGRLRGRKLNPGAFRAGFVATDAAGNRSRRKRVSFMIVRARPRPGPR